MGDPFRLLNLSGLLVQSEDASQLGSGVRKWYLESDRRTDVSEI